MEDVPVRSAFLVDQGGTVRRAWRYDDAEVPDLDAIVAAARAL
jgi:peroxiredoxin